MTLITGAGRYLNAATLANLKGTSPSTPNILGGSSDVGSILEAARGLAVPGMGISGRARALTRDFLNRTADINSMFSYGLGPNATLEGMKQKILAIRATLPVSQLGASVLELDDASTVPASSNGQTVDTEA